MLARISQRIGRYLERSGWLQQDEASGYLQLDALDEESACMDRLRGHSITYRIAIGRHAGKKAVTLQTASAAALHADESLATANGFSLHAGVWAERTPRYWYEDIRCIRKPSMSNTIYRP